VWLPGALSTAVSKPLQIWSAISLFGRRFSERFQDVVQPVEDDFVQVRQGVPGSKILGCTSVSRFEAHRIKAAAANPHRSNRIVRFDRIQWRLRKQREAGALAGRNGAELAT
jgi:hypothetical protein